MSMVYWYLVMSIYFYFVPTLIAIVVVRRQSFFLLYSIVRLIMFKVETVWGCSDSYIFVGVQLWHK